MPRTRRDSLPDRAHYFDTGCEFFPSCLNCPLPECWEGQTAWRYIAAHWDICKLFLETDLTPTEIAERSGYSVRQIQRIQRHLLETM